MFVRCECSVVGRGGSRPALTGAVIMEQAGSTVGAGSIFSNLFNNYFIYINPATLSRSRMIFGAFSGVLQVDFQVTAGSL